MRVKGRPNLGFEYDKRFVGTLFTMVNRLAFKEEFLVKRRAETRIIGERVIKYYGSKCQCCGEERYEFLAIDHINGGGNKHRKSMPRKHRTFREWLDATKPEGFRVLCHNCNMAFGLYRFCPHQGEACKRLS